MKLDPHQAALKLAKLRQSKERQSIREPVTGATQPPLPYRHELIGMPLVRKQDSKNREEGKKMGRSWRKVAICGQVEGYPGCGREIKIEAHGLCAACYKKLRKERAASAPAKPIEPIGPATGPYATVRISLREVLARMDSEQLREMVLAALGEG